MSKNKTWYRPVCLCICIFSAHLGTKTLHLLNTALKSSQEGFIANPSSRVKSKGLSEHTQPGPECPPGPSSRLWNYGISYPKSFKPATRDYTTLFPRPMFLRTDCAPVYAALGPRSGQGMALWRGIDIAQMCVLHGAALGLAHKEKRRWASSPYTVMLQRCRSLKTPRILHSTWFS